MARVHLKQPNELTAEAKAAYEKLEAAGKVTNMKLVMLQDYGIYKAFMGWYDAWESLKRRLAYVRQRFLHTRFLRRTAAFSARCSSLAI